MKLIVRPLVDPEHEIDMTDRLVAAIAEELWRLYGGNQQLNWLEAEAHLMRLIDETRETAAETEVVHLDVDAAPMLEEEEDLVALPYPPRATEQGERPPLRLAGEGRVPLLGGLDHAPLRRVAH